MASSSAPGVASGVSSLVPTASPVPPGIRQISLATKDIVYDPVGARIYATVPSSAANGNSIAQIDPFAGTLGASVFIGSEPGRLAISDNSQYIYAALDATATVRRFDIAAQTAGLEFPLGSDSFKGTYYVEDLAVLPGQPESIAVSRMYKSGSPRHAGVGVYDNGVRRATTTATLSGSNVIESSASAATLYGYNNESSEFGFRKMSISNSGVAVVSTTQGVISGFGVDISYANGLVYSTNGRVINPETATLLGSFPSIVSGSLVVPDPGASRVYFLTGSGSSTLTLKAFNLTTFLPTGSLSIPGVSGTPGSFIKWADDGLAFRTSGNQIFLLSTASIVPMTPTATPTPAQLGNGLTRLTVPTNDLVYDSTTQKVYASIPSSAGTFGNSIAPIDPQTGVMGAAVAVGSEPGRLARSDNGQYIYAGLAGAGSVRRFDVPSQTAGLQFALGTAQFGPLTPDDIAVLPGSAQSVAVARGNSGNFTDSVVVFDDGVVRTGSSLGGNVIEFSSSAATLFGYGQQGSFYKMTVSSSGVGGQVVTGGLISGSADIRYDNGRMYTTTGRVFDPEAGTPLGSFPGASGLVVPDSAAGKIYYLTGIGTATLTLKAYDAVTFTQTGALNISGVAGTPGSFIKAGANLLAFRTESEVDFVPISLINSLPTALPTPVQVAAGIIQLPVAANDLVYDPNTQKVYASLPGSAGSFGNSLAAIDPTTGTMSTPVFIGSEPRKLAISGNNQYIYAGLDGVGAVRRFDLASQTSGLQFSLGNGLFSGPRYVDDMAVLPDDPNAVAIARRNLSQFSRYEGVAIYDSGTPRPNEIGNANLSEAIEFSASASRLYGYNNESTEFGIRKMLVNPFGVSITSTLSTGIQGFGVDIKYDNGNIYSSGGKVINAETGVTVGTISGVNSLAFVPDATVKRVYFVSGTGGPTTLEAFSQDTFQPVGSLSIPGVNGTPLSMIRWGTSGLAFRTSGNQIFFIQTSLVPSASMSPSTTSVTSSLNPSNPGQNVTFTATVSGATPPTGTVQFQDNGVNLGSSQTLSSGLASISTTTLTQGFHVITANYSGDANLLVSSGAVAGGQTVTPALSINDQSTTEGDSGTKIVNFTVTLSAAINQTVTVNYATANGTATAPSDYAATSGTLTFNPGDLSKTIGVTINGDQSFEPNETYFVNLSTPVNASISKAQGIGTILNNDAQGGVVSFSQANYVTDENAGQLTITVNRTGDLSAAVKVDYVTIDAAAPCVNSNNRASSRCDFTAANGTLSFATGESSKTITVLINQDSYVEGVETFTVIMSNLTGGAVFGSVFSATVTINDDPTEPTTNVIDDASNFVRQNYHDFLNREPDASGLAFWTDQITSCGADQACIEIRRINVSAAFFLSIEFQGTGYLVERLYKTSFGDVLQSSTFGGAHQLLVPVVRFNQFLPDTQEIARGVVVGQPGWEMALENNKQAFVAAFVQRSPFTTAFPTTRTPDQFVDQLNTNAGNVLSTTERATAIGLFGSATNTTNLTARVQVLRQIAEDSDLNSAEFNRAFVLMQYFGYMRRNPNDPQDTDYSGYDFWLTKLNQFNGNFVNAEMVKAFITSTEYRQRFGP
ncbi:MAG: hypothetical protein QOK48_2354 [Blastocatellia bacterium]|nr:hypothetical protein [Blastocatellia bacterium]